MCDAYRFRFSCSPVSLARTPSPRYYSIILYLPRCCRVVTAPVLFSLFKYYSCYYYYNYYMRFSSRDGRGQSGAFLDPSSSSPEVRNGLLSNARRFRFSEETPRSAFVNMMQFSCFRRYSLCIIFMIRRTTRKDPQVIYVHVHPLGKIHSDHDLSAVTLFVEM